MANYKQVLKEIYSLELYSTKKEDLSSMFEMDRRLGMPSKQFRSIHVAGTNGKGTLCHQLHAALKRHNKVGLFTSPHIEHYSERFQINGECIEEGVLVELYEQIRAVQGDIHLRYFDMTTLLGLLYFAREKVDVAIIEVGVGGRIDATNIITPILSAITSIGFDHTKYLGNTLEKIAREKGGIIKEGIPVILGSQVKFDSIGAIADEKNAPTYHSDDLLRTALELLDFKSDYSAGAFARPPCRFEMYDDSPPVLLDVAHNINAIEHLFSSIDVPVTIVFGFSKEEGLEECLAFLRKRSDLIFVAPYKHHRLLDPEVLSKRCNLPIFRDFEELKAAGRPIVVCGSFFIMAEIRNLLHRDLKSHLVTRPNRDTPQAEWRALSQAYIQQMRKAPAHDLPCSAKSD